MTGGMLFSQMTPPFGEQERFERWYDDDHIALRMPLPGFVAAHRYWQQLDDAGTRLHHLAIYDLESLDALATSQYQALKADPGAETDYMLSHVTGFTRFITERISDQGEANARGRYLSVVAFAVPDDEAAEFDDWYDSEHAPVLLEAPDWLRVHRYQTISGDGGPWTRIALHELASLDVMDSPERARARRGPKRDGLAGRVWFGSAGRWLYERAATHHAM